LLAVDRGPPLLNEIEAGCKELRELLFKVVEGQAVVLHTVRHEYYLTGLSHKFPIFEVQTPVFVEVDPELAVGVILYTGVRLVVEPVKGSADDVVELYQVNAVDFDPLTVFDEFQDIRSSPHAIGEPASSVPCQAEKSDDPRSL